MTIITTPITTTVTSPVTTTVTTPVDGRAVGTRRSTTATWLPWRDATTIVTPSVERTFVADLEELAGGSEAHTRRDTTAVLNALRGGLTAGELLARAPGLRPRCLVGAYHALEQRRRRAARAWLAIMDHPTIDVLAEHHVAAARLMPVLVERMLDAAMIDPAILPRLGGHIGAAVQEIARAAENIERELDRCVDPDRRASISRTLFDPHADCVYARDDHLPVRVGALVPTRVASLLGERELRPLAEAS